MKRVDEQLEKLKSFLAARTSGGVALAFSGGVDSSFLLHILSEMRREADFPLFVLTARSVFQPASEIADAARHAAAAGVTIEYFNFDPLADPEIRRNPPDRCYICKKRIFSGLKAFADAHGAATLLDGTNADDLSTYRPGILALRELAVVSPLAELNIGKAKIRELAAALGLPFAAKPSSPCLATRFEYGTLLVLERLCAVARGEALIRRFLPEDADLRLRSYGDLAGIEVEPRHMPALIEHGAEIVSGLRAFGFRRATLDLAGFRSGSMDELSGI